MSFRSLSLWVSALQRLTFRWRLRRDVIGFCVLTLSIGIAPTQTAAIAGGRTQYIVDGLALGDLVAPRSATYREYKCRASEQFASFIWCHAEGQRTANSVNSRPILHAPDGATAYVSRYIEPAYFAPGDVEREINRLSQRFGAAPHICSRHSPSRVIAYWGDVTLTPLDSRSLAQLAAGQSVTAGMLFDFLGNFGASARDGIPIFQLGGASGYVWGARFDQNEKGALRMTAIDASQFSVPSSVANGGDSSPTPPPDTQRSVGRGDTPSPGPQPEIRLWAGPVFS